MQQQTLKVQESPKKSCKCMSTTTFVLLLVLTAVVFTALGAFGYYFLTKEKEDQTPVDQTTTTTTSTTTTTATTIEDTTTYTYTGWVDYENTRLGIKFKVPSDWEQIGPDDREVRFYNADEIQVLSVHIFPHFDQDEWCDMEALSLGGEGRAERTSTGAYICYLDDEEHLYANDYTDQDPSLHFEGGAFEEYDMEFWKKLSATVEFI